MTDQEFDNTPFTSNDEVVVRKYFGTEKMRVCRVDFPNRTVNGYTATEIIKYINNGTDRSVTAQRLDKRDMAQAAEGQESPRTF